MSEALDGFTWETQAVGEHLYRDHGYVCRLCGHTRLSLTPGFADCPSVQERRLVGPWQPVVPG